MQIRAQKGVPDNARAFEEPISWPRAHADWPSSNVAAWPQWVYKRPASRRLGWCQFSFIWQLSQFLALLSLATSSEFNPLLPCRCLIGQWKKVKNTCGEINFMFSSLRWSFARCWQPDSFVQWSWFCLGREAGVDCCCWMACTREGPRLCQESLSLSAVAADLWLEVNSAVVFLSTSCCFLCNCVKINHLTCFGWFVEWH